jgi:hypothetical protein
MMLTFCELDIYEVPNFGFKIMHDLDQVNPTDRISNMDTDTDKSLPVGISDFMKMRDPDNNYLYIDKTLMIKDIIEDGAKVILITRPRGWGKTLNISMLDRFFGSAPEKKMEIFKRLDISTVDLGEYMKMEARPVIFISFHSVNDITFEGGLKSIILLISKLFEFHQQAFDGKLRGYDSERYTKYLKGNVNQQELAHSIFVLCILYAKHHDQKSIVLIDDHDTPLNTAYENDNGTNNYYREMTAFFAGFFAKTLKDNRYLYKAVVTGVLRIAKESTVNNLMLYSLLHEPYNC